MNIIRSFIQMLLQVIYSLVGDYGLAIIGVTLTTRLLLLPLNLKQRKSMEKQQAVSQKLTEIKEKHKGNPKKINEETQKYMQTNGTGMTGCLLALLQLPIMFALNSVIRNQLVGDTTSFLLPWITSLSIRDPYFILPFITILVQLLPQLFPYLPCFKQLKLPKSNGGMILYLVFMNGIFTVSIPSGIGLYWMISSFYTFIEQLIYHLISIRKIKAKEKEFA